MEEDASEFGDWEVLAAGDLDGDGDGNEEEASSGDVCGGGDIRSDHFAVVWPPAASSSSSSGYSWADAREDDGDEVALDEVAVVGDARSGGTLDFDQSEGGEAEGVDLLPQISSEGIGLANRAATHRLDLVSGGGSERAGLGRLEAAERLGFDAIKAGGGSEGEELQQEISVSRASFEGISSGNHESAGSFDLDGTEVAHDASGREEPEQMPGEGINTEHHETQQLEQRGSVPRVHLDATSPAHSTTTENLDAEPITASSEAESDRGKQESLDLEVSFQSGDDDASSQRGRTSIELIGSGSDGAGACGELEEVRDGALPPVESAAASEGERKGIVWWKLPFGLLRYCAWKARPVWSISIAAALVGLVMLGRRMYKMRRKSRSIPQIKIAMDDKRASQFAARTARLNEAFLMVRRVPVIRTSSGAVVPWSMLQER